MIHQEIAKVCHEANRALCETQGDFSQPKWEDAPEWQVKSAVMGVDFCIKNPNAPASANHESWYQQKVADGWKYGPVKSPEFKEHPCMVAFEDLPKAQQAKDVLFKAIVASLAPMIEFPAENHSHTSTPAEEA